MDFWPGPQEINAMCWELIDQESKPKSFMLLFVLLYLSLLCRLFRAGFCYISGFS